MNENAYSAPAVQHAARVEIKGAGWTQFFGILQIIGGILYCLPIFTIPIGLPTILSGLALYRGGGMARAYSLSRDPDLADQALREMLRSFRILGLAFLILSLLMAAAILFAVLIGSTAGILESIQNQ
ncbi:MAG: hypothetical protein HS115_07990 [Spirochaetales bacterium]|nr:hypothetical protein [Spirochaetales bacterium]